MEIYIHLSRRCLNICTHTLCTGGHKPSVNNKYALPKQLLAKREYVFLSLPVTLLSTRRGTNCVYCASLSVCVCHLAGLRKENTRQAEDILLMYTSLVGPPGPQCPGVGGTVGGGGVGVGGLVRGLNW